MKLKIIIKYCIVITAFLLLGIASLHAAEVRSAVMGGGGGIKTTRLDCGSTGVMVGLFGRWGQWLDQMGVRCRRINSNGSLGSHYSVGPVGGSGGDHGGTKLCEDNEIVTYIRLKYGSFVHNISNGCMRWDRSRRRPTGSLNVRNGIGPRIWIEPMPGGSHECPTPMVMKAVRVKHGKYIDSVQLVCDDWNR